MNNFSRTPADVKMRRARYSQISKNLKTVLLKLERTRNVVAYTVSANKQTETLGVNINIPIFI